LPKAFRLKLTDISWSRWTAFGVIISIGCLFFKEGVPFIMSWDLLGHHAYLPLTFHERSLILDDLVFFEGIREKYHNTPYFYQFGLLENGHFLIKFCSGWAFMMLPFYLVAELWAHFGNYPNDGFSWPYQCMMACGAFTYFVLGILVLRKLLLEFFPEKLSSMLILLVVFGTNFFFMQYASQGSSHNLEFFLVGAFLLVTVRFHRKTSIGNGMLLGFLVGLIGLVRPPDLLLVLIPAGWNYGEYGGLWGKAKYFLSSPIRRVTILSIGIALLTLSPQFFYWKAVSGSWLVNSYANNPGEGFDWFTPYLPQVLFSFRKGWFLYTPLMVFAVAGLFFWRKSRKEQGNVALVAFLLFLYVVSCWTTWWYAESFSQRALVDVYPLLTISLGFLLLHVQKHRIRFVIFPLMVLLVGFNLFQTYQITRGIIDGGRMTKAYYWSVFGQVSPPSEAQKKLLLIDRIQAMNQRFVPGDGYEKCFEKSIIFEPVALLDKENIYAPAVDILPKDVTQKDHFWLTATWKYEGNASLLEGKVFNASPLYKGNPYYWVGQLVGDSLLTVDSASNEVRFQYLSPNLRTPRDVIRVGVWNQSGPDIKILSVRVEGYSAK
jgi:hypothetical protein